VKDDGEDRNTLMNHVAWGRDLTAQLADSGFSCFAAAKNCVVNMKETPFRLTSESLAEMTEDKSTRLLTFDAAMRVQCQNVDWAALTTAEQHFAAAKLMRAFNAAHDGKKTLQQDIQWESNAAQIASLMDYMLGFSSSYKSRLGYFRGSLLLTNDGENAGIKNLRQSGSDAAVMDLDLWESKFEAFLAEGPYSALSHARQCQIEIDVVPSA
jgi:hypothetical protein